MVRNSVLVAADAAVNGDVYGELTAHDSWHHVGKHLFADYAARHDGDEPYVNPMNAAAMAIGRVVTPQRRQELLERKERFRRFLARCAARLLGRIDDCSDYLRGQGEIAVFPLNQGTPSYCSTVRQASSRCAETDSISRRTSRVAVRTATRSRRWAVCPRSSCRLGKSRVRQRRESIRLTLQITRGSPIRLSICRSPCRCRRPLATISCSMTSSICSPTMV